MQSSDNQEENLINQSSNGGTHFWKKIKGGWMYVNVFTSKIDEIIVETQITEEDKVYSHRSGNFNDIIKLMDFIERAYQGKSSSLQ